MSRHVDKVFHALNAATQGIEVKRSGLFGARKVIINGQECLLKDLMAKVNGHIRELHAYAKQRPNELKNLHNQIQSLHKILVKTKLMDAQERVSFGIFFNLFGRSRKKELTSMSQALKAVDQLVQDENKRKLDTLELLLDPQGEPSLTTLKGMDLIQIAKDFPSIEPVFQEKINQLPKDAQERTNAEAKMSIMRERVDQFVTLNTLSVILDQDEQWDVAELKKMDMIKIADDFPLIEAAFRLKMEGISSDSPVYKLGEKKLEILRELKDYAQVLKKDNFKAHFINQVVLYRLELKNEGISSAFPSRLDFGKEPEAVQAGRVVDNSGKLFNHLRQKRTKEGAYITGDTLTDKFTAFCKKRGGDYGVIRKWFRSQAVDSWSPESRKIKQIFMNYREVAEEKLWSGPEPAERSLIATEVEMKTVSMHLAYVAEALSIIDFPGKNKDGTITLYRTESKEVLEMHQIKAPSQTDEHSFPRGAGESTSWGDAVAVYGTEVTEQHVPFHRVIGVFFTEPLLIDAEKEFICMLDGIPFKYTHTIVAA